MIKRIDSKLNRNFYNKKSWIKISISSDMNNNIENRHNWQTWIDDNIKENWAYRVPQLVEFTNEEDAMLFWLHWG